MPRYAESCHGRRCLYKQYRSLDIDHCAFPAEPKMQSLPWPTSLRHQPRPRLPSGVCRTEYQCGQSHSRRDSTSESGPGLWLSVAERRRLLARECREEGNGIRLYPAARRDDHQLQHEAGHLREGRGRPRCRGDHRLGLRLADDRITRTSLRTSLSSPADYHAYLCVDAECWE